MVASVHSLGCKKEISSSNAMVSPKNEICVKVLFWIHKTQVETADFLRPKELI